MMNGIAAYDTRRRGYALPIGVDDRSSAATGGRRSVLCRAVSVALLLLLAAVVEPSTSLFGSPSVADAAGFFVATDGSDGDDGSIEQPWETLAHAFDQLDPGDTLYVRGGTYYEAPTASRSGTAGSPIVIQSYPGERGFLDSGSPQFRTAGNDDWELVNASLGEYRSTASVPSGNIYAYVTGVPGYENEWVGLVPYVGVNHFRSTTDQYGGDFSSFYVGPGTFRVGDRVHIRLAKTNDLRFAEQRYGTVFATENADPRQYSIVLSTAAYTLRVTGAYLEFRDLTFHPAKETVLLDPTAHDVTFDTVTAWWGDTTFEIEGAHHVTITRSKVYGDYPYWLFWSDMKDLPAPADKYRGTSIDMNSGAHDIEISYSHVRGSGQDLLATKNNEYNIFVHHNRIENGGDDAFEIEGTVNVGRIEVHDNYFLNSLTTLAPGQSTPNFTGPLLVYRNVMALLRSPPVNRQAGINSWNGGYRYGFNYMFKHQDGLGDLSRNVHYYHNTLVLLNSNDRGLNILPVDPTDGRIANNIKIAVNGTVNRDFTSAPGLVMDGNLYWKVSDVDGDPLIDDYDTVAEFNAATGHEANGIGDTPERGTDPQLQGFQLSVVDDTEERWELHPLSERFDLADFIPDSGSPGIGAGIVIPSVPGLGTLPDSRSSSDIGAIPFGTSPSEFDIFPFDPQGPLTGQDPRPVVTITEPADGAIVAGTINVAVTASDNGAVTDVELYREGLLVASSASSSLNFAWDTSLGPDGFQTLTAKAFDTLGQEGTDEATVRVRNDVIAPTVAITTPGNGETVSGTITVHVDASDNMSVDTIELYLDGNLIGSASSPSFSFSWDTETVSNGVHDLIAQASDAGGNVGISATVSVSVFNTNPGGPNLLVPRESVWRYHDLGQDLGTAWRDTSYVDTSWATGQGPLGYGESYITTPVSYGPDPDNRYWTTYFRTTFNIAGASSVTDLTLRIMYDDGYVIYLNGSEVKRDKMPDGTITYTTPAKKKHTANNSYQNKSIDQFIGLLVDGENVLAGEIHQRDANSSTLVFDVELEAVGGTIDVSPPPVPGLLSPADAESVGPTPTFDWFDVSDPSGVSYALQIDDDPGFASPVVDVSGLGFSSYAAPTLDAGGFSWRVRATDGIGLTSAWSPVRSFTVDATAPAAVLLVAPADSATSSTLPAFDWTDGNDPSGVSYRIQVDDDPGFGSPQIDLGGIAVSTHTPAALPDGHYAWRVRVIDGVGFESPWSEVRTLTLDTTAPTAAVLVVPADSAVVAATPVFDWADVNDASGTTYRFQLDDSTDFASPEVDAQGLSLSVIAPGPLAEASYVWRVQVRDGVGHESPWSEVRTLILDVTAPGPVALVAPLDGSAHATTPVFDWEDTTEPGSPTYHFQIDEDSSFSAPIIDESGLGTSSYDAPPLNEGVYLWRVRVHDGPGPGAWSQVWRTTIDASPPPAPTLLVPADQDTVDGAPAFDWSDVTDLSGVSYQLQVDDDPDFSSPAIDVSALVVSQHTPAALDSGAFMWRVQTINGAGLASGWSATRTVINDAASIPGVGGLLVARTSDWTYHDQGVDLGTAWQALGFDDSAWATGPGVFGYGESYITTEVSFGPDAGNKYPTTYFRNVFDVHRAADVTGLRLRVTWDDGFVAYINGVEVLRGSMPAGPIDYTTHASGHESDHVYEEFELTPFIGLLQEGQNVIAVEAHQGSSSSSDMVFDAELESDGSGLPGQVDTTPPAVAALLSPGDGTTSGSPPTFDWDDVVDPSGVSYRFQLDDDVDFSSPLFDLSGLPTSTYTPAVLDTGTYVWRVEAIDGVGLPSGWSQAWTVVVDESSPNPGVGGLLVTRTSNWKYHDLGQDLGTVWRETGYDDATWSSGPGVFGYGEDYITTVVSFGPDPGNKYRTTYFRNSFNVVGAAAVTGLKLRVTYDDGVVVYLNGIEVMRGSMPAGPIDYNTDASSHESNNTYEEIDLAAFIGLLVEGPNVVAAEVHQGSASSSDMAFDAELESEGSGTGTVSVGELDTPPAATLRMWPVPYRHGLLTIEFSSFDPGASTPVDVSVYDLGGRRVRTLARGRFANGIHRVTWNARDAGGTRVAPGVYLLEARRGSVVQTRKLIVVR